MSTSVLHRPSPPAPEAADMGGGGGRAALARFLARRWWPAAAEVLLALGVAALFTVWAVTIDDNPMVRVGQVSGLAALQYRMAWGALPLLVVVGWASLRASRPVRQLVVRLAAAAAVGLIGGFLGGGQMFMLRGTPWGLAGELADNGRLIEWTQEVLRSGHFENIYPPGIPHTAAFIARHFEHGQAAMAFKPLFVAMVAWSPSVVYLAWRMVLRPLPAVAIAVFGCLMEYLPYKPYDSLTLMLLVPVIAKLAQWLRSSPGFSVKGAVLRGLWLGAMLGVIFLVYSGWHWWSFPGTAVLVAALFPWRRAGREGRLRGLLLLGGALAGFLAIGGVYLREMLGATGTKDTWCSYVTQTDPGYIGQVPLSTHQWELPGTWPPPGEIAGLGFFALFVTAGLGVAVAFGLRRAPVAATVACFVSSWFLRFYLAHNMEKNGEVQLFPRTAMEIQYTLIVLAVLACVLCADRVRALAVTVMRLAESRRITVARLRPVQFGAMGTLLALLLIGGMGASYMTDQYMPAPKSRGTMGYLALRAQQLREPDGTCPDHAGSSCITPHELKPVPTQATTPLACRNLYQRFDPPATQP